MLAAATGCAFVAKDEVRCNWLLRWLADQNATLYVRRSERRGAGEQAQAIARALGRGRPLALFPEGTTGDGVELLPMRSALLAAVAPPPAGVTVRPVAIDYGRLTGDIAWTGGESGLANALRVLGLKGPIHVKVRLLEPLEPVADRKQLAALARQRLIEALPAFASPPAGL